MYYYEIINEATPLANSAFRRWFGDSKIVHADGTPMIVFHGTFSDITAFDLEKAGSEGGALFFIRDADIKQHVVGAKSASGYAMHGENGNVMPVYLKIANPYVTGFADEIPSDDQQVDDWVQRQSAFDQQFDDDRYKINYYKEAIRYARRSGHDGVIFRRITDDRVHRGVRSMPSDIFAVFHPTQIKSAIGNRGSFKSADPRITESER